MPKVSVRNTKGQFISGGPVGERHPNWKGGTDAKMARFRQTSRWFFHTLKWNAAKRNIPVEFTIEEFMQWHARQDKRCHYCGIEEQIVSKTKLRFAGRITKRLTVDRKNPRLPYRFSNLVLACFPCNAVKNIILTEKEMKEIGKEYIRKKWKTWSK